MKSKTIILAAALCGFMFTAALGQTADTIYQNGSILTMAGKDPTYVEALAVKDSKIVFAGAKAAALKMKGDSTEVVDVVETIKEGTTIFPAPADTKALVAASSDKTYS